MPVQPPSFLSLSLPLYCIFLSVPLFIHPLASLKKLIKLREKSKIKNTMSPTCSSRWSPTTEQLMILEELYRSGIRTPSASQIQQITTHLSFYGRIEGKNVFYWFQNHKARDRQKLRRKLSKQLQLQQQQIQLHHCQLNQDITNHFVGNFGYPSLSASQDFPFFNSPSLLFQGGAGNTSEQALNCKCNVHIAQSNLVEKEEMTFCNYGWTLMDANNQASSCCTRPLKTLDLFPLTTTVTNQDCTTPPK